MASEDLARSGTARLEEFVALNDELAALVRAGLPLELGIGPDGRRRVAGRITERLRQGRSLDEALRLEGTALPPGYRAVIEAGLRSGRLVQAVESVSRTARVMITLRRRLALASIYPAIVVVLVAALALLLVPRLLTAVDGIIRQSHDTPSPVVRGPLWLLEENPTGWLYWLPFVALFLLWGTGGVTALAFRLPGIGPALRSYRLAAFAELAAALLDHGTPLDEAMTLAAGASGDRRLAGEALLAARSLGEGRSAAEALAELRSLPRFARWMLTAGAAQGTLEATLRHVADWAARRGAARADWFSLVAPAAMTLLIGGTAVIAFAAVTFGPVVELLYRLTWEMSL